MENIAKKLDGTMICLNCNNTIVRHSLDNNFGYFYCNNCNNIHLICNNIWIFLPDTHEDFHVWNHFYLNCRDQIDKLHITAFKHKIYRIRDNNKQTWEDEDTKHWDESYFQAQQPHNQDDIEAILDLRTYTRKIHLIKYLQNVNLGNKLLCEIGAGRAVTIRKLLSPLSYLYYYIPTDYSYEALRFLQKNLGLQDNIQYIQCLGNKLPFCDNSIDYMFSLGVLHHMPQKENHIKEVMPKIKLDGFFLFYEGYAKKTLLSKLFFKYGKYLVEPDQSAHEERIDRTNLEKIMTNYDVIHYKHEYSPFLTISMIFYNKLKINNLTSLKFLLFFDQVVINSIGRVFKTFSSGACFVVLKKKQNKHDHR